jgi:hypothetical protein
MEFFFGRLAPSPHPDGVSFPQEHAMEEVSYTKGLYTAVATTRPMNGGLYQGVVSLARDDGEELENAVYEVEGTSGTPEEALEEAKALAHRILGELEL